MIIEHKVCLLPLGSCTELPIEPIESPLKASFIQYLPIKQHLLVKSSQRIFPYLNCWSLPEVSETMGIPSDMARDLRPSEAFPPYVVSTMASRELLRSSLNA